MISPSLFEVFSARFIMYRLRFHLGAGPYFMYWQVRIRDEVQYYNPNEVIIRAYNCTLRNRPNVARQIFEGANKTVCAWIDCEFIDISPKEENPPELCRSAQIYFNPKNNPFWTIGGEFYGKNFDGKFIPSIMTLGKSVFTDYDPRFIIGAANG